MGRFEAPVEFYRYREPYPAAFFESVVGQLGLNRGTRLLDVGCGPGILAIGFAPFVGRSTAIDPEPGMLRAARAAASHAHVQIEFLETPIEALQSRDSSFDFVTIGRALHWLNRDKALAVLDRIVAPGGRIAICGAPTTDAPINAWAPKFKEVRNDWASERDESRYRPDLDQWFASSRFRRVEDLSVLHRHRVMVEDLVRRALSYSTTSLAVIADRRPHFEAAVRAAVEPFSDDGAIEEEVAAKATIFA